LWYWGFILFLYILEELVLYHSVVLAIFEIGFHFMPRLSWNVIFLCVLLHVAGMAGVYHCIQLVAEMGSHELFAQYITLYQD
jgi:hypothetical protein